MEEVARSRGRKRSKDGTRVTSQAVCSLSLKGKGAGQSGERVRAASFYSLVLTRRCRVTERALVRDEQLTVLAVRQTRETCEVGGSGTVRRLNKNQGMAASSSVS